MRRWIVLLLGAALVLLASLYLPWQQASCGSVCLGRQAGGGTDLLNLLGRNLSLDGWSSGVGDAAALFALLLVAVAAVALARPNLAGRLPLGLCALLMGYFGLAVAAEARSAAHQREAALPGTDFHYAYGAYLGVAAAVVALVAAVATRRRDLGRARSPSLLATIVLGVALLVSFLLPWEYYFLGIASPAAVVAAALVPCLLVASRAQRPVLGVAVGVFTAGAFSSLAFPGSHAYGAWLGLGVAIALPALAIAGSGRPSLQPPRSHVLATGGAAALLVTALFLPWQEACYERSSGFGPYAGRCISTNGWTSSLGAAAALLAFGLLLTIVASRPSLPRATLTLGIALMIATLGYQLTDGNESGVRLERGYGSTIGFVAAGLLLALAVVGLSVPRSGWNRAPLRLVPVAVCVAYLVVVVLPWWGVPAPFVRSTLRFAPLSWLTITGALLAIWLLQLWVERIFRPSARAQALVIVPLAMLSLAALDLIRLRDNGFSWGRGTVVVLCLLLAALGRLEQQGGLEHIRVPAALRVDRL